MTDERRDRRRPMRRRETAPAQQKVWVPRTQLGRLVADGTITDIAEIMNKGHPIMEVEIVDKLVPELNEKDYQEVLNINMVQRMTDSGRRVQFSVIAIVGNKNGYVGMGSGKSREVGPAIRKAVDNAKLNLIQVRRGCGSWECGCGTPHSVPFKAKGECASVTVELIPAPKGLGLAMGEVGKKILTLAGIRDVWSKSFGQTQTTPNFAGAVFNALSTMGSMSLTEHQVKDIGIQVGKVAK
jgi:small subunit ribosomal protein S5